LEDSERSAGDLAENHQLVHLGQSYREVRGLEEL
jgi:hypothetical protein